MQCITHAYHNPISPNLFKGNKILSWALKSLDCFSVLFYRFVQSIVCICQNLPIYSKHSLFPTIWRPWTIWKPSKQGLIRPKLALFCTRPAPSATVQLKRAFTGPTEISQNWIEGIGPVSDQYTKCHNIPKGKAELGQNRFHYGW